MFSCICMLKQSSIHFFIDPSQNLKKSKKIQFEFYIKKEWKSITRRIFVVENSAWRQMKMNYQIYLPHQFRLRDQSAGWDSQLSNKKIKTMFLSNMSKSWRLTSTFFPITIFYFESHKIYYFDACWHAECRGWMLAVLS